MTGFVRKAAVCMALVALALQACADANAASKRRHQAKARVAAAPQLIVCGMTGCFDVPPGCRHEMRRNGRGVVAVVICGSEVRLVPR
ncbi:MAG: hypothetical protein AB1490_03465 [Pseudomonadota bacterium]